MSVAVIKPQVAILARSSREMSQTVHIDSKHFVSRVRVSVRPRHFVTRKTIKNYCEYRVACTTVHLNEPATPVSAVMVERHRPVATTAIIAAKTVKSNNSKREFIPSRQVAPYVTNHTESDVRDQSKRP